MKKRLISILFILFWGIQCITYSFAKNETIIQENHFIPGVVVAKLKSGVNLSRVMTQTAKKDLSKFNLQMKPKFPSHSQGKSLSQILEIQFDPQIHPSLVIEKLSKLNIFEYVEPRYISHLLTTIPNDTLIEKQSHFSQISMFDGWDISRGSSEIVIAIVDNGTDYHHPDLKANIWKNQAEFSGIPGVDDDLNGYVDDIYGWDFGENDNDPIHGTDESIIAVHGTHTAGIASAVTNNITGIAGIGWNCQIMPVKISRDDNTYQTPFGYEGIVYAADNGAHIISNSWGRRGNYSQYEQDVINYAASKGCIIVAAGGNSNTRTFYYPAAYTNVIAVAAVNEEDQKASYSTYEKYIDISAPGGDRRVGKAGIFSLYPTDRGMYGELSGTSMAAPIVSGVIGLLKEQFPEFSNFQLSRQIILTANNINSVNLEYAGLIGYGRVNAFRALTEDVQEEESAKISLFKTATSDSVWGNGNFLYENNEIISVDVWYRNFAISPGLDFEIRLNSADASIEFIRDRVVVESFPSDSLMHIQNQLSFRVKNNAVPHLAKLSLDFNLRNGTGGSDTLFAIIGKSSVLLVDDDDGIHNVEKFYTNILDNLNVPFLLWDHVKLGSPPPQTILHFPTIIWFCEWAFPSLSPEDRVALQNYLNHGGRLFISGQDIGWDLSDPDDTENNQYSELSVQFYQNYLHSIYMADNSISDSVIGVPGTIGQNLNFKIYQPNIPRHFQFPDWIKPASDAQSCFEYHNQKVGGVIFENSHRVLNLGFGFEAVDGSFRDDPKRYSYPRYELMTRILNRFGPLIHDPLPDIETSTAPINFTVKSAGLIDQPILVSLFWKNDTMPSFVEQPLNSFNEHIYQHIIDFTQQTGKIQYYFELTTPYFTFRLPVTAPDTPYQFRIGSDTDPPEIFHQKLNDLIVQNQDRPVKVYVQDNAQLDTNSVWLHFRTASRQDSIPMNQRSENWFHAALPPMYDFGDSICYFFSAKDKASPANYGRSTLYYYLLGFENFENGTQFWSYSKHGWGLDDIQFHSKMYSISTRPGGAYQNNSNLSLTLKRSIPRKFLKEVILTFWTKYELETDQDFGFVEISLDNGKTWNKTGPAITGINKNWMKRLYSLGQYYSPNNDSLSLRFRLQTDATQQRPMAGWFIDDISLQTEKVVANINDPENEVNQIVQFQLLTNYPNPFNNRTTIRYSLSEIALVTLQIFNVNGQKVVDKIIGLIQPGNNSIHWDGKNTQGSQCSSGVYFCHLKIALPNRETHLSNAIKLIYIK